MISRKELNPQGHVLTAEQEANQVILNKLVNLVRAEYGKPMFTTSGVRSWDEHAAIYKKMNRQPPKGSAHLIGAAVDFADRDGKLAAWCIENVPKLKQWGLYLEDPSCTVGWVHLQSVPPRSGNTVFIPYIKKAKS